MGYGSMDVAVIKVTCSIPGTNICYFLFTCTSCLPQKDKCVYKSELLEPEGNKYIVCVTHNPAGHNTSFSEEATPGRGEDKILKPVSPVHFFPETTPGTSSLSAAISGMDKKAELPRRLSV